MGLLLLRSNTGEGRLVLMNTYRVSYKVEGVRIIDVILPEGLQPPNGFHLWDYSKQDEWLYSNQIATRTFLEDVHYAEADSVLKVRQLRAV
jgi:hypothetical protein